MPRIALHEPSDASPQRYNAFDVCITHEINPRIKALNPGFIYDFERALQGPVMEMMLRGVRVDPNARAKVITKLEADLTAVKAMLKRIVEAITEQPYNEKFPNSGTQLREFFYQRMRILPLSSWVKGEERQPMDRKILERLEMHFEARPIVWLILSHRDITKQLQVLKTQIDHDFRMRVSFHIAGTKTGRFSSSKSTVGTGQNIQNIAPDLRHIFVADKHHKIFSIDKEQAESREVGVFCGLVLGDWSYLDACESGDLHTYVCRLIWPHLSWNGDPAHDRQLAENKFYRHYTYRDMAKRCGHGSNYYGKPPTIAGEIKVPVKLVEEFQLAYFKAFPCIANMHRWVARELQTKFQLTNRFGRVRDFFGKPTDDTTLRGAIAYIFQSATADDLNLGLLRIWERVGHRLQLLLQLHDAVYFQIHKDEDENEIIDIVRECLDVRMNFNGRSFSVPIDIKAGYNLGNRFKFDDFGNKEEVNPTGLDKWKPKVPANDDEERIAA